MSPVVFILLCNLGQYGGLLKLMKSVISILDFIFYCAPFPQNFGQVLAQIILSLVIIVRAFCIVLKLMRKAEIEVLLAV